MKIYDISRPINSEMAVYKNREAKKIKRKIVADFETRGFNESELSMNLHTGTHIDAPLHMLDQGESIDEQSLELYLGRAQVLDFSHLDRAIEREDLAQYEFKPGEIVVLKTRNSEEEHFNPEFIYLSADGASFLIEQKVKSIAIDAMSVERGLKDHPAHILILEAGLGLIEDIRLAGISEAYYDFIALPLAITGAEASPTRAILIDKFR